MISAYSVVRIVRSSQQPASCEFLRQIDSRVFPFHRGQRKKCYIVVHYGMQILPIDLPRRRFSRRVLRVLHVGEGANMEANRESPLRNRSSLRLFLGYSARGRWWRGLYV